MPPRCPPILPADLDPSQRKAYDEASQICLAAFGESGVNFPYKDANGSFIGNFAALLYSPNAMIPFMRYAVVLGSLPGLPPNVRETAILAVGDWFQAPFVTFSHRSQAFATGLTAKQVEILAGGAKPAGSDKLDEACEVAFDVAREAMEGRGRVGDGNWARAEKMLGKDGTAALVHYVGFYAYACVIQNMAEIEAPEEK